MERTTLRINLADGVVYANDKPLRLSPRFFRLYCLLAVARLESEFSDGGYVESERIHTLPGWQNNELLSIGKQLRLHVRQLMESGLHLIEAIQKTGGPYRLGLARNQIRIVGKRSAIPGILGHAAHPESFLAQTEQELYTFVEHLSRGTIAIDDGSLDEALLQFQAASKRKVTTSLHALALLNLARVYEKRQQLSEAAALCDETVHWLRTVKASSSWAMARAHALQAWIRLQQGAITQARRQYQRALVRASGSEEYRLLGDIHNGLGTIEKREGHFAEAVISFRRALENWTLAQYLYGIQACYFNIGNIQYLWAKALLDVDSRAAKKRLELARLWIEPCISLCNLAGTGFDANDAEILLASIYRRTGHLDKALAYGRTARKIAEASGSPKHLQAAYLALLKVHKEMSNQKAIDQTMREARASLDADGVKQLETYLLPDKSP
jgi:tetratricopeptide (TPR) repeat protein